MNWLLIAILLILVGNLIWGWKKGFISVAISLVSWVVVLVACYIATPIVSGVILEATPLAEIIQETVSEELNEVVDKAIEGAAGALNQEAIAEIEAQIPEQIKASILGEHENIADLITSAGDIQIDTTALAETASYLIALVIVMIVTRIALVVVEKALNLVAKLPLIGEANALLGIGAGIAKGVIWCWVVMTVIALLAYTGTNTELLTLVNESEILIWLYENNLIMNVLSGVL